MSATERGMGGNCYKMRGALQDTDDDNQKFPVSHEDEMTSTIFKDVTG